MAKNKFMLVARIDSKNQRAIKQTLNGLIPKVLITSKDEGIMVKAIMYGESARELNRTLLSALRKIERKTRLRSEWTAKGITERFFDYVPKGTRKT